MTTKPTNESSQFKPAYKLVPQTNDLDDVLAVTAMLSNKSLADVRQVATTKFQIPAQGAWYLDERMLGQLLADHGFIAGTWKEVKKVAELPDLCLLMLDYKKGTAATGRHVLFHRNRDAGRVEYVLDPHPATPPDKRVRVDLSDLQAPLWHIPVRPVTSDKK